ncbi:unnamed protein product [Owenia fusiformis]|uniref:Kinesin motor domain-containing protein n=1 Tax=Owenia fusiformis TaxID=6347 RepID=A0A8S4NEK6_OWEFU|nr:unnamed protein product [Owenia fusiformis]
MKGDGNSSSLSSTSGDGDSIKVYLRVRPMDSSIDSSTNCLDVNTNRNSIVMQCKPEPKLFTYDCVGDSNITQDSVFQTAATDIIESSISGYNGTIFAYGQTGSGKTYTMLGPSELESFQNDKRGLIPRSFEHLFQNIRGKTESTDNDTKWEFLIKVSFLEIYQEQVYDLLDTTAAPKHLREDIKRGVYVEALTEYTVSNAAEAYEVLSTGWNSRTVASTQMNRESSRSHAVMTVTIESKETRGEVENVRMSQLHLVDLAGSERQKDTNAVGGRLKEAGSINKSLSTLGHVMMTLVEKGKGKQRFVPYRDSKLTFLLRDALGGNAKTFMIACVHPGFKCIGETLSTLQFARRAKMIKNKAVVNEDTRGNILALQAEIKYLKMCLASSGIENMSQPSGDTTEPNEPATESTDPGVEQWKKNFIDAMLYVEQMQRKKQLLEDKVKDAEKLLEEKSKAIQRQEMMFKYKNSRIDQLLKPGRDIDYQQLNTDLQQEIDLRHKGCRRIDEYIQLDTRRKLLERERTDLLNQESYRLGRATDQKRVQELLNELQKLQRSEELRDGGMGKSTPSTSEREATVAIGTERLKSQIQDMQAEMESVRQEKEEMKEGFRKKEIELQADIEAKDSYIQELETKYKATKAKNAASHQLHNDLIKRLTPTKSSLKYNLRNRPVLGPRDSLTPGGYSDDEEGISDMLAPQQMIDEEKETLREELHKVKDANLEVEKKLEAAEADLIMTRQTRSKLEHQNEKLEDLLNKERCEWKEQANQLNTKIQSLQKDINDITSQLSMKESEVIDLSCMMDNAEREKKSMKQDQDRQAHLLADHQTRVLVLEAESAKVLKQFEETQKDYFTTRDRSESLQVEVYALESNIEEARTKLEEVTQLNMQLEAELKDTHNRLKQQEQSNINLLQDKDQATQELVQEKGSLEGELTKVTKEKDTLQAELDEERNKLVEVQEKLAESTRLNEVNKTEVKKFMQQYSSEHEEKETLQTEVDRKSSCITDLLQEVTILKRDLDQITDEKAHVTSQFQHLDNEKSQMANKYEVELSLMRDEFDYNIESANDALEAEQASCKSLEAELQLRNKELEGINKEFSKRSEQYYKLQEEFAKLEAERTSEDVVRGLQDRNDELRTEAERLRPLLKEIEDMEELLTKRGEENAKLREEMKQMEKQAESNHSVVVSRFDQLTAENQLLQKDLTASQKKIAELHEQNAHLIGHQNHKQKIQYHAKIKEENDKLREELVQVKQDRNRLQFEINKSKDNKTIDTGTPNREKKRIGSSTHTPHRDSKLSLKPQGTPLKENMIPKAKGLTPRVATKGVNVGEEGSGST